MSGTTIFLRTPTLKLTIGQRNGLKSFMKKTNDKKEYRRAQAVLEKSEGKTHKAIAKEQAQMKEQPKDGLLHISRKTLKDYRYVGIADLNQA